MLFSCKEVKDSNLARVIIDKDWIPHLDDQGSAVRLVAD
jgi:hypothetical protein